MVAGDVARAIARALKQDEARNQTKPKHEMERLNMANTNQNQGINVGNVTYGVEREPAPMRTDEQWEKMMELEGKVFGRYGISAQVVRKIAEWERMQEKKVGHRVVTPTIRIKEMDVSFATIDEASKETVVTRRTINGEGKRMTARKMISPAQQTAIENMRRQLGIEHNLTTRTRPMKNVEGKEYWVEGGGLLPHTMRNMSIDSASVMIEDLTWMRNKMMEKELYIKQLEEAVANKEQVEKLRQQARDEAKKALERQAENARRGAYN